MSSFTLGVPMIPTSAPFLIVPANPQKFTNNHTEFAHFTPSFPVALTHKSAKSSDLNVSGRVAHNNAHHLHSIPPAHKSTKSMILDHLLHLHADARLAQVSAELGVSTIDQDFQESPVTSEQLCHALRYGPHVPSTSFNLKGGRDEPLARALMARANGLEKVIGAILGNATSNGSLPESVRFRIALGMLIDDIVTFRHVESTNQPSTSTIPPMLTSLSKPHRESNAGSPATASIFNSHSWAQPLGIVGSTLAREPSRSKELFNFGASPLMSPSLCCTRHLVRSCHLCAAKVTSSSSQTSIGSGLASTKIFPDRGDSNGSWGTLESIPYFLQLSALVCSRLSAAQRQQRRHERNIRESLNDTASFASTSSFSSTESGTPHPASSAGDMPVSEEEEQVPNNTSPSPRKRGLLPFRFSRGDASPYLHHHPQPCDSKQGMGIVDAEEETVQPTREWYALLASLITRALLEGYLLRGWKGTHAAEVLFGVGLANHEGKLQGRKRKKEEQKKTNGKSSFFVWKGVEHHQEQLEVEAKAPTEPEGSSASDILPEDLPSMEEVSSILFGNSAAFQEYLTEMSKRFIEFTTVTQQTPDLTSHLDALARAYPLEPIQTAALRFCEAVALWRKNPELEEYKSRSGQNEGTSFSITNGIRQRQTNDYMSSPSIQSHSPVLQSTPSAQRARLSPSISIASLVHPSSSPPLSSTQPASDSISFLGLSNSNSSASGSFHLSVIPAPLQQFFFTTLGTTSSPDDITAGIGLTGAKMNSGGGSRLGWAGFTLGAKRPREKETEGWESERAAKKAFLRGGFNS